MTHAASPSPSRRTQDAKAASKQKDLVQRLESTIIHWTRQIKEVVNQQDSLDAGESSGPLDEIQFWRERRWAWMQWAAHSITAWVPAGWGLQPCSCLRAGGLTLVI